MVALFSHSRRALSVQQRWLQDCIGARLRWFRTSRDVAVPSAKCRDRALSHRRKAQKQRDNGTARLFSICWLMLFMRLKQIDVDFAGHAPLRLGLSLWVSNDQHLLDCTGGLVHLPGPVWLGTVETGIARDLIIHPGKYFLRIACALHSTHRYV